MYIYFYLYLSGQQPVIMKTGRFPLTEPHMYIIRMFNIMVDEPLGSDRAVIFDW